MRTTDLNLSRVEVAVGVLHRADGALLVQERRAGTDCAGQWEFPGGKREPGEAMLYTLSRELEEELGIRPVEPVELTVLEHDYPHAKVRLHVFMVAHWHGKVMALEGQNIQWLQAGQVRQLDILEAAYPLLDLAERALAR